MKQSSEQRFFFSSCKIWVLDVFICLEAGSVHSVWLVFTLNLSVWCHSTFKLQLTWWPPFARLFLNFCRIYYCLLILRQLTQAHWTVAQSQCHKSLRRGTAKHNLMQLFLFYCQVVEVFDIKLARKKQQFSPNGLVFCIVHLTKHRYTLMLISYLL